ncbi:MAG: hypothetical protein Q9188_002679 [Gyalolechia gomerana]
MVAGARARTIPCATDLADLAGMRVDRFLRSAHSNRFACAHGGNARRGKATAGPRDTALKVGGAWAQAYAKRQLPPLPQEVLVQHLISAGRPGQAFWIWVPPLEVQSAVGMQTPGAPPAPVQGPLATARSTR